MAARVPESASPYPEEEPEKRAEKRSGRRKKKADKPNSAGGDGSAVAGGGGAGAGAGAAENDGGPGDDSDSEQRCLLLTRFFKTPAACSGCGQQVWSLKSGRKGIACTHTLPRGCGRRWHTGCVARLDPPLCTGRLLLAQIKSGGSTAGSPAGAGEGAGSAGGASKEKGGGRKHVLKHVESFEIHDKSSPVISSKSGYTAITDDKRKSLLEEISSSAGINDTASASSSSSSSSSSLSVSGDSRKHRRKNHPRLKRVDTGEIRDASLPQTAGAQVADPSVGRKRRSLMLDELTEVAQNKDRRLSTPEQVRWADAPQTTAGPSSSTSGRSSRASSASSGSAAGSVAAVAGSAPGVPKLVLPAVLELDASSGEDDGSRDFEEDEDVIDTPRLAQRANDPREPTAAFVAEKLFHELFEPHFETNTNGTLIGGIANCDEGRTLCGGAPTTAMAKWSLCTEKRRSGDAAERLARTGLLIDLNSVETDYGQSCRHHSTRFYRVCKRSSDDFKDGKEIFEAALQWNVAARESPQLLAVERCWFDDEQAILVTLPIGWDCHREGDGNLCTPPEFSMASYLEKYGVRDLRWHGETDRQKKSRINFEGLPEDMALPILRDVSHALAAMQRHNLPPRIPDFESMVYDPHRREGNIVCFPFAGPSQRQQHHAANECQVSAPMFVAPEILEEGGTQDWTGVSWCLGEVAYMLVMGFNPFSESLVSSAAELYMRRLAGEFDYAAIDSSGPREAEVELFKPLIEGCLKIERDERMPMGEVLEYCQRMVTR